MAEDSASDDTDCSQALHELYEFLDGQLTVERRALISRHLERCPPCQDHGDFEIELRQVIATRCRETVPDHLKAKVAAALHALQHEAGS
jgi:anti-sigma factor (TIGR02949 family)